MSYNMCAVPNKIHRSGNNLNTISNVTVIINVYNKLTVCQRRTLGYHDVIIDQNRECEINH